MFYLVLKNTHYSTHKLLLKLLFLLTISWVLFTEKRFEIIRSNGVLNSSSCARWALTRPPGYWILVPFEYPFEKYLYIYIVDTVCAFVPTKIYNPLTYPSFCFPLLHRNWKAVEVFKNSVLPMSIWLNWPERGWAQDAAYWKGTTTGIIGKTILCSGYPYPWICWLEIFCSKCKSCLDIQPP